MHPRRLAALAALSLALGCSTDDLTSADDIFSPALDHDIALVAGDAAAEDVEVMGGPAGPLGLDAAAASLGHPRLACEDRTRGGLTITRSCAFRDANGVEQSSFDPQTTARADVHVNVEGTIEREHWDATVDRFREFVVTGLEGTESTRTWNGAGNGEVTRSRHRENAETRTYEITYTSRLHDVIVPVPRAEERWPLSGTITRDAHVVVTGGPHDGREADREVTITFNGTRFVPIVVNGTTYTFDLRLRRIVQE